MPVQQPKITGSARCRSRDLDLRVGRIGSAAPVAVEDQIDLGGLEAGDGQIEIDLKLEQLLELERQSVPIPIRQLGQLVVGKADQPQLFLAQVTGRNGGHLGQAETPRRLDPRLPDHDPGPLWIIDNDREQETMRGDVAHQELDLPDRMPAQAATEALQARYRQVAQLQSEVRSAKLQIESACGHLARHMGGGFQRSPSRRANSTRAHGTILQTVTGAWRRSRGLVHGSRESVRVAAKTRAATRVAPAIR